MFLDIKQDVDLQSLNTLSVPCLTRYFLVVDSVSQLQAALKWVKDQNLPILILGGGSNTLLPSLFSGLTVHINILGIDIIQQEGKNIYLEVGAGVVWHDLVLHCLQARIYGLENLSLIPGTVGAAPIQNIGAYGVELDTVFENLSAVDRGSHELLQLNREQCEFSYRHSIFKESAKDQYVISSVVLRLSTVPTINVSYPALKIALQDIPEKNITPELVSEAVCSIRQQKLPDPKVIPNAGSFFKNPIISKQDRQNLQDRHSDLVSYPYLNDTYKIAAGWLLDKAGWRGYSTNGVGVHEYQALVLINPGRRPVTDVLDLAKKIQTDIESKFGIFLEIEPVSVR